MTYILHISYEVCHAPALDTYILDALEGFTDDLDSIRDDETRDIYLYFSNNKEVEHANNLLKENGQRKIDSSVGDFCLLDFIRFNILKKDKFQKTKIDSKKRIAELHRKHKINDVVETGENDIS